MRASAIVISAFLLAAAPAAAQRPNQGDDESAELVAEGRSLLREGNYDGAGKALDQAIALNPRRLEAYGLRAAVHAAKGEHARGVAIMRKARLLAPENVDVQAALGTQLVLAGELGEGVPLLEGVVAKAPAQYGAQVLLGHHYADQGQWADSAKALEAYFRSRPKELSKNDDRHRLDLAEAYLRTYRPGDARVLFAGISERNEKWLSAKMGLAWSLAAIDCRQARPVLADLSRRNDAPIEVLLVRGQCALELGDPGEALRMARAYLDEAEAATAAGHALLGEAEAARGNLKAARASLEQARTLEPGRRRYVVRLARVLRLGKDPAAALAELEGVGAPTPVSADRTYWIELGEALLDAGQVSEVAARLAPAAEAFPDTPELAAVLGDAALRGGDAAGAAVQLEIAMRSPTPRVRKLLGQALLAVAVTRLDGGDVAGAAVALTRADEVDGTPAVWRNLGLCSYLLGDLDKAQQLLARAAAAEPSAPTLILLGRVKAARGDATARESLAQAVTAGKGEAIAVDAAIELAAVDLASGRATEAVEALLGTAVAARKAGGDHVTRHTAALVTSRHAAGLAALRAGQATRAVGFLEDAVGGASGDQATAVRCDLALATVATSDRDKAVARLKAVAKVKCPFPAPADTTAVPVLLAFVEGLQPRRAAKALDRLAALDRGATGTTRALLATATRVVALNAAEDAYRSGKLGPARKYLTTAKKAEARVLADEVAHNLAVLDVADGRLDTAIAVLDRLAPKLPEALVNLGVAYDRKGDGARALELWRRAQRDGVRFGPLDDWIDAKARIFGGEK
jgi:tetratricopeptide (TPR) repeat protein